MIFVVWRKLLGSPEIEVYTENINTSLSIIFFTFEVLKRGLGKN